MILLDLLADDLLHWMDAAPDGVSRRVLTWLNPGSKFTRLAPKADRVLLARGVRRCTKIQHSLATRLSATRDDGERAIQFGIENATRQCQGPIEHGVRGLHLYCLNRARSATAVVRNLGLA